MRTDESICTGSAPDLPILPYDDVLSVYRSARLLKKGGQKAAFLVEDDKRGKVVLKVGLCSSKVSLRRAEREVATMRSIDSRFYPRNYEFREISGGRFVIVEEYVESRPLSGMLGEFDACSTLRLCTLVVDGLTILWNMRIIHRDIKPDNLLIRPDGAPVIIDLGIARALDSTALTLSFWQRGPCTPPYAAVEQLTNRKTAIDHRTDQFALGIVLAQLLMKGQHPFDPAVVGAGESIPDNILGGAWCKAKLSRAAPAPLVAVVGRMLGREPHQRYRTPATLRSALDDCGKELGYQ
jgi:serine/threonine protein kinase